VSSSLATTWCSPGSSRAAERCRTAAATVPLSSALDRRSLSGCGDNNSFDSSESALDAAPAPPRTAPPPVVMVRRAPTRSDLSEVARKLRGPRKGIEGRISAPPPPPRISHLHSQIGTLVDGKFFVGGAGAFFEKSFSAAQSRSPQKSTNAIHFPQVKIFLSIAS